MSRPSPETAEAGRRTVPRCLWLVWVGVACAVLTARMPLPARYWILCVPIVVLCLCNVHRVSGRLRVGAVLVLAGLVLNGLVIGANGAMPFSARSAQVAGVSADYIAAPPGDRVVVGAGTRLAVLADMVPLPGLSWVVSFGDIVAATGVCVVVVGAAAAGLRDRSRREGR